MLVNTASFKFLEIGLLNWYLREQIHFFSQLNKVSYYIFCILVLFIGHLKFPYIFFLFCKGDIFFLFLEREKNWKLVTTLNMFFFCNSDIYFLILPPKKYGKLATILGCNDLPSMFTFPFLFKLLLNLTIEQNQRRFHFSSHCTLK